MGVYNPMAKMPRACGECEDRYKCQYSDMTIPRRSDDCPLIEVKAPHGDLIDRGELQNRVSDEYRAWGDDYDALQILGDIEDAPTVIEAEVE